MAYPSLTDAVPAQFCPNMCSGHGRCQNDGKCYCAPEYNTGLVPDCSWRVCPSGKAWADKAYDVDLAHNDVECSGAGSCNRYRGACECYDGYTGMACERMACPLKCSGHGQCYTLGTMYELYNYTRSQIDVYGSWDTDKSMGCACDYGYTGGACELRMCPKGHDPLDTTSHLYKIEVQTWSPNGALGGMFQFFFNGKSFKFSANANNFDDERCRQAFAGLPNVDSVKCHNNGMDYLYGGTTYFVEFSAWPKRPYENNIYTNDGRPHISDFHCDASNVSNSANSPVLCTVREGNTSSLAVVKYDYCSNRGICEMSTGDCTCFQNFYGAACETYVPQEYYDEFEDVMSIEATNSAFTKSVLRIADTMRGDDGAWSSLYMETNEETYDSNRTAHFNISSYGDVTLYNGGWTLAGPRDGLTGVEIYTGGLTVRDGITINDEGLEIVLNGDAGDMHVWSGAANLTGGLTMTDLGVHNNGLIITGGITVEGGMVVPDCKFPRAGGVKSGTFGVGCGFSEGMFVGSGGADIANGGMWVNNGMNVSGGLMMEEWKTTGVTVETGGLHVMNGGMTVHYKGLVVDRASAVRNDGLTVGDGLSLHYDGLTVTSDGITVTAGGLTTPTMRVDTGGMSADTVLVKDSMAVEGNLYIHDGSLEATGGAVITGGVNITAAPSSSGGLSVTLAGGTIHAGGLHVTDGVTIATDGLYSGNSGPISISGGLRVTGGITMANDKLVITEGGVTVPTDGVSVAYPGVTVASNGVTVTGASTIGGTGLNVQSNGVSITAGGLDVDAGGIRISGESGMSVAGGVSVTGGAFIVDSGSVFDAVNVTDANINVAEGGITVAGNGLHVSSGTVTIAADGMTVNKPRDHTTDAYHPDPFAASGGLTSATVVNFGGGVNVWGGVSIGAGGLDINSPAENDAGGWGNQHLTNDGLTSTGGMTIGAGLKIEGPPGTEWGHLNVGAVVSSGGLVVTAGGMSTFDGGAHISGGISVTAGGMRVDAETSSFAIRDGVGITGGLSVTNGGMFIQGDASTASYISDEGGVVTAGGMTVAMYGVTANSAKFNTKTWGETHTGRANEHRDPVVITGGLRVQDTGLTIAKFDHWDINTKYGLYMTATGVNTGLHIKAEGLSINHDGLTVSEGGAWVPTSGVAVTGGLTIYSETLTAVSERGGLFLGSGDFENTGAAVSVHGGVTVKGEGLQVTGGLSVKTGGLHVVEGNLTSYGTDSSAAVAITGGLVTALVRIKDGGLDVTSDGVAATGGVTINDGGIPVLKGGISVMDGGMEVTTGGVTVTAGGLMVNGAIGGGSGKGLTITAGDLVVADDLYINQETIYYSGSYTITSDRRLKGDVEALAPDESLEKVKALRGVYFYWDRAVDRFRSSARQVGLLAQDVQAVLPEAVKEMAEKPFLGVTYEAVIPLLIEALRALREKFVSLSRATSQEAKLEKKERAKKSRKQLLADIQELEVLLSGAEERGAALESLFASATSK